MNYYDFENIITRLFQVNKKAEALHYEMVQEPVTNWYYDIVIDTIFYAFGITHTDDSYTLLYNYLETDKQPSVKILFNKLIKLQKEENEDNE